MAAVTEYACAFASPKDLYQVSSSDSRRGDASPADVPLQRNGVVKLRRIPGSAEIQRRNSRQFRAQAATKPGTGLKGSDRNKAEGAERPLVLKTDDPLAGRPYRPAMEGDEPDFWEGPQWNWLGFLLQYLWAFGILVAIIASIYAVRTYNTGAVDFTQTEMFEALTAGSSDSSSAEVAAPSSMAIDDAPPL
eukprot:TRINITY_DN1719_c0_g1_i2.p1 TRINITY_DN1719_c0_g1~~TRINITY_DN1719_c0_g1_i2.p1  ORF type:complete len:199 (+),score=40.33 TRINITY_DN1719_c0_g1_i2:25-597(+)